MALLHLKYLDKIMYQSLKDNIIKLFNDICNVYSQGEIIQWEQQIRLRHLTTRKYICITSEHEVILIDSNEDPRTVFRLHSVINVSYEMISDL